MRQAKPAEFIADFERRSPEMPAFSDSYEPNALTATRAPMVTPLSRTDEAEPRPPFNPVTVAPVPAPTVPSVEITRCRLRCCVAKFTIGRVTAPILVAAIQQIEENCARDDGDTLRADFKADALFAQGGLNAGRRINPNADPPDKTSALIASTVLCGSRRSVSRVPGAPPRTWTAAVAGISQRMTVQPDLILRPKRARLSIQRRR